MLDTLFVYGTLRSSASQHWRLARQANLISPAHMNGRLYMLGGYPALQITAHAHGPVTGELYRLLHAPTLLRELDIYEGADYVREINSAVIPSGETIPCWVYVYRGAVEESRYLSSGDFLTPSL